MFLLLDTMLFPLHLMNNGIWKDISPGSYQTRSTYFWYQANWPGEDDFAHLVWPCKVFISVSSLVQNFFPSFARLMKMSTKWSLILQDLTEETEFYIASLIHKSCSFTSFIGLSKVSSTHSQSWSWINIDS